MAQTLHQKKWKDPSDDTALVYWVGFQGELRSHQCKWVSFICFFLIFPNYFSKILFFFFTCINLTRFSPKLYLFLFFYRHLKLFQDQLKHQSENFYKDDMKIEAHIVRKESAIIGLNYSKGSQIIFFCLKCKRSYAFRFYHLPYNMFGISGHPLTIATSSEFPFLHFCKNINRARLRGWRLWILTYFRNKRFMPD